MVNRLHNRVPRPRLWMVTVAGLLLVAAGTCAAYLTGSVVLRDMMAGAITEVLGRAVMVFQGSRFWGASKAVQALSAMRRGQLLKFLLCALLFALIFSSEAEMKPAAVLAGYGVFAILGTALTAKVCR